MITKRMEMQYGGDNGGALMVIDDKLSQRQPPAPLAAEEQDHTMLKKLFILLAVFSCCLTVPAANRQTEITMLVVPRDPVLVQIALDISRRYPAMLVCYQQGGGQTAIHAWDGRKWGGISEADYANGAFFKLNPRHTVIVEKEAGAAPEIVVPDGSWCEAGNRLATTDPRAVIHLLGRYFDFSYSHWLQFCRRYNYELEAVNPSLINVRWWHHRGKEGLPAIQARDDNADMDEWLYLDTSPAVPVAPEVLQTVEDLTADPGEMPEPVIEPATDESMEELFETEEYVGMGASDLEEMDSEMTEDAEPEPEPEAVEPAEPKAEEPAVEESTDPTPEPEGQKQDKTAAIMDEPVGLASDTKVEEPKPAVPAGEMDPFSADEIPAAKIIPPAK